MLTFAVWLPPSYMDCYLIKFEKKLKITKKKLKNKLKAIPIKCFVSHHPPSREGGSVGRSVGQKKKGTIT